ncbi:hypothetical protein NliqN6_5419 [Naganishia liquefaciens]|uniref:Store-operated calcium entry-associated regulatory factor n=1 Tax=Naganishia liquefaciens TaxID=104408 RepID=A0A8H3TXM4_9TREE|nr:hypothetical protein NliqN6_5419 [Naganishia liquefaciens]
MRSTRHDKVLLQSVKTLTFHKGGVTKAKRTEPIPQLTCKGKACKRYQPDVVQCTNTGDDGLGNVQWKCEADMPSSFRFGPVEVSCEGYSRPGDKYVLQGSCGLEYSLVRIDPGFEEGSMPYVPGNGINWASTLFSLAFLGMLSLILYSFLRSCIRRFSPRHTPPPASRFWPFSGGGGGGGGGGPGGGPGGNGGGSFSAPPPPYSKYQSSTNASVPPGAATQDPTQPAGGRPGFWTGIGLGGLAAYLAANAAATREENRRRERELAQSAWFGTRIGSGSGYDAMADGTGLFGAGARRRGWEDSRWGGGTGVGSSSTMSRGDSDGEMRRSTGFGGTNVR